MPQQTPPPNAPASLTTTTPARGLPRWAKWAALPALGLAAWAGAIIALWWKQERLLFAPLPLPMDKPIVDDPDVTERFVDVPGARLSVLELRVPSPRGVVFFLHGNSDNMQHWFVNLDFYRTAQLDMVMMDYRGFGKSSGRIESETQLHADVWAVWQTVADRYGGKPMIIYARSLGTGLAVELAWRLKPALTVLISAYASMAALARLHYAWVPPQVLRYPLRTDQTLARVQSPLLLVHGDLDDLIPHSQSAQLAAASPHARLVTIEGAGHGDIHEFPVYQQLMVDAVAEVLDGIPIPLPAAAAPPSEVAVTPAPVPGQVNATG